MGKRERRVKQLLERPTSLGYADIEKLLRHFGFEKVPAKGSHVKFKHARFMHDLIIPVHRGDCKNFYKKEVSKRIRRLQES